MSMHNCLPIMLIVTSLNSDPQLWKDGERIHEDQWLPQAKEAWQEYCRSYSKTPHVCRFTRRRSGSESTIKVIFDCSLSNHFLLITEHLGDFRPGEHAAQAYVANPRYAFRLVKHKNQTPWILEDLHTSASSRDGFISDFFASVTSSRTPGVMIFNLPLLQVHQSNDFRILNARAQLINGRPFLRVDFEHLPEDRASSPVEGGWFILDPQNHWLIDEYQALIRYFVTGPTSLMVKHEYLTRPGQTPFLRRTRLVEKSR